MARIYTFINEETVKRAYERAYKELDEMTEGRVDEAMELTVELNELSKILQEIKEQKEEKEEKQKKELSFAEMLKD